MEKLFGTAGIRKKYPRPLDAVLAYRIGLAVAVINNQKGRAYIVHDTRTTSGVFTSAIASGLLSGGMDAFLIGLAPTPVAGYAAEKHGDLGVSVTASHNPPEYNGFKFYDAEGYEYTRDLESMIEELVRNGVEPVAWDRVGRLYSSPEIIDEYVDELVSRLGVPDKKWSPTIVVDLANGAAYDITPRIIRMLGAKPLTINASPDGYFPIRPPEPRKDVLEKYLGLYSAVNTPMILAHDGDADRLAVLDPVKGFIRQDRVIALYAYLLLQEKKGHVVVSIDTGRVVEEVVEKMGGSIERYVLGKTHERVKQLGKNNIVLAAEPWKLIDPRWGAWVDGIWQAALLTKTVLEEGLPLAKILDKYGIPDYPWDRRSYKFEPVEARDKIYSDLVEELKTRLGEPVSVETIDGVRYNYKDNSWVLIRKSGTEPKIRLYMEAIDKQRLQDMIEVVEKLVKTLASKHDAVITEKTIG